MLECNLIKEYRPKYNTMLRDDKTYPYIKVTLGEPYPRVLFSRTLRRTRAVTSALIPARGRSRIPSS